MKKKKFLALLAAGVMSLSMSLTAFAATPEEILSNGYSVDEVGDGTIDLTEDEWGHLFDYLWEQGLLSYGEYNGETGWWIDIAGYNALVAKLIGPGSSERVSDPESEAVALSIKAMGYDNKTYVAAEAEGKTVAEYMNNAVVETWGIEDAVPVAQGGDVVINGEKTNVEFSVLTVTSGQTAYAQSLAKSVGGTLLNVARINSSVYFDTAAVNFYMPGVKAGQNIQVYQYDRESAQWVKVDVTEVREDHVVVNMTSYGIMAFIDVAAN